MFPVVLTYVANKWLNVKILSVVMVHHIREEVKRQEEVIFSTHIYIYNQIAQHEKM